MGNRSDTLLMVAGCALTFFSGIQLLLVLPGTRWRRLSVLISFQHQECNDKPRLVAGTFRLNGRVAG
jgi:hypothetical protein